MYKLHSRVHRWPKLLVWYMTPWVGLAESVASIVLAPSGYGVGWKVSYLRWLQDRGYLK